MLKSTGTKCSICSDDGMGFAYIIIIILHLVPVLFAFLSLHIL